jgi:hypothetical protein
VDEAEPHKVEIQFLHFCPKPRCSIMCSRYAQFTISKALAMSSLMNREEIFFLCRLFITSEHKQSYHGCTFFLMKAVWLMKMISFNYDPNLFAMSFEIVFVKL